MPWRKFNLHPATACGMLLATLVLFMILQGVAVGLILLATAATIGITVWMRKRLG